MSLFLDLRGEGEKCFDTFRYQKAGSNRVKLNIPIAILEKITKKYFTFLGTNNIFVECTCISHLHMTNSLSYSYYTSGMLEKRKIEIESGR